MKKSLRILAVSVMLIMMISAMSVSAFATRDVNYIPDFSGEPSPYRADILVLAHRETRNLTTLLQGDVAGKDITWTSTDEKIADVNSQGIVKAYSLGTCYVTATYSVGDGKTEMEYFYISSVNNVQNDYGVITLHVGESFNICELFLPAYVERTYTGATSNPLTVVVDGNTGIVTAKEPGVKTVTVNFVDTNNDKWAFPLRVQVID